MVVIQFIDRFTLYDNIFFTKEIYTIASIHFFTMI